MITPRRLRTQIRQLRVAQLCVATTALYFAGGCATTEVTGPLPAKPPEYIGVPHPVGFDQSDLKALFFEASAPKPETLQGCDADYRKLKDLARNEDELKQGTLELIQQDPVRYHWCFFHQLLTLEEDLKSDKFVDEKQSETIHTFAFLTPIARGFVQGFNDSRYLRWAVQRYRHVSQWFFYRKLDLTPRASAELVDAARPFGLWRTPAEAKPVLDKYKLGQVANAGTTPATAPMAEVHPATQPSDPAASPATAPAQGAPAAAPESASPAPTPAAAEVAPTPQ